MNFYFRKTLHSCECHHVIINPWSPFCVTTDWILNWNGLLTFSKFKNTWSKRNRLMSACSLCAGWYKSILYADALSPFSKRIVRLQLLMCSYQRPWKINKQLEYLFIYLQRIIRHYEIEEKEKVYQVKYFSSCVLKLYYIPSSEILEFPSVTNFDIITSDDINFHFHFQP